MEYENFKPYNEKPNKAIFVAIAIGVILLIAIIVLATKFVNSGEDDVSQKQETEISTVENVNVPEIKESEEENELTEYNEYREDLDDSMQQIEDIMSVIEQD